MSEQLENEQELAFLNATLRVNAKLFGIVLGIVFGVAIFLATNWLIIKGPQPNGLGAPVVGPHLALLGQYFIGYRVTFLGSFVGFVYGFVVGSLTGWLMALIYNRVADVRS